MEENASAFVVQHTIKDTKGGMIKKRPLHYAISHYIMTQTLFHKMENESFKRKLINWHIYLLVFILLNFVTGVVTDYRINQILMFCLKTIFYLTGILLFFKTLRPFNLVTVYFLFYTISAVLAGLFFLFGGIFLEILSFIILYPIHPTKTEYKSDTVKIYDTFQGFMAPCCSYEVVEPKLYIFEKHLGYIRIGKPIDADKDEFSISNNKIIHKYKLEHYEYGKQPEKMQDTTEILNFE